MSQTIAAPGASAPPGRGTGSPGNAPGTRGSSGTPGSTRKKFSPGRLRFLLVPPVAHHHPQRSPWRAAAFLVLLVALWQIGSTTGIIPERTLAAPTTVIATGVDLVASGQLQHHLLVSLSRAMTGLAIGVAIGAVLAVVAGLFRLGEDVIDGPMQIMRAIPGLALVPLAIVWFGIGEEVKVFLVVFGTTFPVYVNMHAAIRGVDPRYVELARTVGLGHWALIRRVILPGSLPGFFVGLRFAVSISWLVLVVSEQINATSGIGFLMNQARSFAQTDVIVVGLAVYGLLGLTSDLLVRYVERKVLSWRRTFEAQ